MKKKMNSERISGMKVLVLALGLSALLFPLSCSKDTDGGIGDGTENMPIRFKLAEEQTVKGMLPMSNASLDTFGVFACHIPDGTYESATDEDNYASLMQNLNFRYMLNVPYFKVPDKGWFDATPERYWPVSGRLTMFAYTPYMSNEKLQQAIAPGWTFGDGYPTIQWTPDSDPHKQIDICIAVAKNSARSPFVPVTFHHATSQIYVAANYVELAENEFIIIDSVCISNIIDSKTVEVSEIPPYVNWEPDGNKPRNAKYSLTRKLGLLNDVHIPTSEASPRGDVISTDAGRLFLVPQTYSATSKDVEISVKYTLYYQDVIHGGAIDTMSTVTMEGIMPKCTWEPDRSYRIVLTLHDKTQWIEPAIIEEYGSKVAEYYPMVVNFDSPKITKTVGEEFDVTVNVGPVDVTALNKQVDWFSSSSDTASVAVSTNPDDNTLKAHVVCKKIGECIISVKTKYAASEEEKKTAQFELEILPKEGSIEPYGTSTYGW